MPEPETKLQAAFLASAIKKHEDKQGCYLFVNIDDGNSFVGRTAEEAFLKDNYWYGEYPYWSPFCLGPHQRNMIGVRI